MTEIPVLQKTIARLDELTSLAAHFCSDLRSHGQKGEAAEKQDGRQRGLAYRKTYRSKKAENMNRPGKNKKRTATIVGIAVLLIAAGAWAGIGYAVRKTVLGEIRRLAGEQATVEAGRIGFNPLRRSLRIRNLRIAIDSSRNDARYPGLKNLDVRIRRIAIDNVRSTGKDGPRSITIGSLDIERPDISIAFADRKTAPQPSATKKNTTGTISVGRIAIDEGSLEICRTDNGHETCRRATGISFETGGIESALSAPDPESLSRTALVLSVRRMEYIYGRGSMRLQADTVALDTKRGTLSIEAFRLLPQYPKDEFASRAPGHADWTRIETGRIEGHGIDFASAVREKTLRADSLTIGSADISSYKNRQIARQERYKPLFFQTLQRMPFRTDIGRVAFSDAKARYEELPTRGTVAGAVFFDSLQGTMATDADDTSRLRLEVRGRLMDTARLRAVFRFPADSTGTRFDVEGRMEQLDPKAMNETTEPLGGIRFDAGRIDGMQFRIEGDTLRSTVSMRLLYDGLDISVMKENQRGEFRERRILSALADDWLIRKSNPEQGKLREGTGTCTRDPYRSQFNYLWKSLLPGIESTVLTGHKNRGPAERTEPKR